MEGSLQLILCQSIQILGDIIGYILMIRIFLSFLNISYENPVMRFLCAMTEPVLIPIRAVIDRIIKRPMMVDFSPIFAWIFIDLIVDALCALIRFIIL